MNELPITPIRSQYADKSAEGKNLDMAIYGDASGNVTVTTIEQTEANVTITSVPTLPTGLVVKEGTEPYICLKVINGVLWVNAVIAITNTGDSTYSGALTLFPALAIPESLAAKIRRIDGSTVDTTSTANFITYLPAFQNNSSKACVMGSYSRNNLNIYIDGVGIAAGGSSTFAIRGAITLL